MDFSRIQVWPGIALCCCLFGVGCAESNGYMDYSDLPPVDAASEQNQMSPTTSATPAPEDVSAGSDQTTKVDAGVVPVNAAGDSEDTGSGTHAANSVDAVADGDDPSTTVHPLQSTSADGDLVPVAAQYPELDENRKITLLVPEKRFRSENGGKALRVSYDDIDLLKVLNMHPVPTDAVDYFPDWLNELDGKHIRIRGFMYPPFKSESLTKFILTRDTGACCFGPDPLIYFLIPVKLAGGESTDYIHRKPFDIEGIFRIDPEDEDGELLQLYRLENARMVD